jgi:hypothetical protein
VPQILKTASTEKLCGAMRIATITGLVAASIFLTGCGKSNSPSSSASPAEAPTNGASVSEPIDATPAPAPATAFSSSPVTQPILTAWQEGDKANAIGLFLRADWNARPIFAPGMALSLSEDQFKVLPDADREIKYKELMAQLDLLKQLVGAVAQAGRDAAANGDAAQARKCFVSLKQFGVALDSPEQMGPVRVVGQVSRNMADTEMAKVGK